MKPVKLEIIIEAMGDGFKDVFDGLDSSKEKLELLVAMQRDYIKTLRGDLAQLKKDFDRSQDIDEIKALTANIMELEAELDDAEVALDLLERGLKESADGSKTLRSQIRELENEMANMTEGTEEYARAMKRLGELRDLQGDISQQGRVLADDEKNIRATADAIAGLSGAMSAGVGIASLFGAEQEKLQQIQVRLQSVMATTIGLQQVAQTLNKDSYFSIVLLQGAKKKWAAAQALLNTQLGIGVGLSKALMVGGVGLLIAGITALVVAYNKWKKKQEEINALKQEFVDLDVNAIKAMAKSKVEAEQLLKIAKDQTKNYEIREKAIQRLKSIMPEYNGHINQEGVLVGNATTSLKKYLEVLYKVEKAKALFAGIEQDQSDLDALERTGSKHLTFLEEVWIGFHNIFSRKAGDRVMGRLVAKNSQEWIAEVNKLQDSIKAKNKELSDLVNDNTIFNALFGEESEDRISGPSAPENKLAEQRIATYRRIKEMEIAIMEDGEKKRKAQAKLEYENRLEEIARDKATREKHLQELIKAKMPVSKDEVDAISTQALDEALLAKRKYDNEIRAIDTAAAAHYKAIQEEIRLNFETRLNRQLADTDAYYTDLMKKASGNMTLIARVSSAWILARKQVTHEAQLRELELENELAMRKQEIDNGRVQLAVDRQEKLLQIELAGQRERLAKLEEMQRDGIEVAEDIKLTRAEIDRLSASLRKMPVERVREIGGYLKEWLSTLSGIGGDAGEALSALSSSVDGIIRSLDDEATTGDQISVAISGLTDLYKMAANQLEENKRLQREWNEAIEETVHKARLMRVEELKYKEANLFGVENPYAKAIAGARQYRVAMMELNSSIAKLAAGSVQVGTTKVYSAKNILTGLGGGASAGAAIGSVIPGVGTLIGGVIGGVLGGIFGATRKKVVPVFESITRQFGSILKEGTETFELNPAILENYSKLDDATKKLVDNWEEIRGKALDAQEQMRQTFSDLAGDIGGSLSDALVNSFKSGDVFGAIGEFDKKLGSTMENIVSQLIFASYFQDMFDELEQRMSDSFDDTGDGGIVDDIIWFSKEYKSNIEAYGEAMRQAQEALKQQGFDLFLPDGRSAASKGISGLTQDQGNKLEGQLTNVQGRLMNIDKNVIDMANFLFRLFDPINRIADNTDHLEGIEVAAKRTTEVLERMDRDGLNLKH